MAEVKMVNFNPQKIMQAMMDIFGDRYGAKITVTVEPKTTALAVIPADREEKQKVAQETTTQGESERWQEL